jgi:hypothetical protein
MLFFHMTKLGTIDISSTPAEKCYFGGLAVLKLNCILLSIDLIGTNFRHTSKNFEGGGGELEKLKEKKLFSQKRLSNLGRLTVHKILAPISCVISIPRIKPSFRPFVFKNLSKELKKLKLFCILI